MRPVDPKCRQGSSFIDGSYYTEENSLTPEEKQVHQYLLHKNLYVDLANVEKNPQIQAAAPLEPKEMFNGHKNNLPKIDPYDVTMSNQAASEYQTRDNVLDSGTNELIKRYSNNQEDRGNLATPIPKFDSSVFDPVSALSGSASSVRKLHKARDERYQYMSKFDNAQTSNQIYLKENQQNLRMYDDYKIPLAGQQNFNGQFGYNFNGGHPTKLTAVFNDPIPQQSIRYINRKN